MDVDGLNAGYASTILEQYLENPDSVPSEWRALFEADAGDTLAGLPGLARLVERARLAPPAAQDGNGAAAVAAPAPPAQPPAPPAADELLLGGVAAAMALVKAYRMHGHLAARLDPLGSEPVGDPALEPERLIPRLTPELQAQIPASLLRLSVPAETLADALPRLRDTYCGTIAYEIEHISDHERRVWLRQAIESGAYRRPLEPDEKRRLLERLTEVEGFERYLRRAFLGQKQFSIEGLDVMVPMLDESIALVAEAGAHEVVIGMPHRGRLSVVAQTIGQPYETILREFEGERTIEAVVSDPEGGSGDVKYHLGAAGVRKTASGEIAVTLCANPSHLEAVDPVVEGRTRAEQTDRSTRAGVHDPAVALPILIHGDASFAGQGVVAETLNVEGLAGYTTGGTLHLIANNQIGFTTDPAEARSTRYSSDLAKGFDIPIIHVNADDPEAAISAIRLALAFRRRFGHDVVVDLVGYRRFGHNEQDEPAYTQPLMAQRIAAHPTVREQFAGRLVEEGVIDAEGVATLERRVEEMMRAAHERLRETFGHDAPAEAPPPARPAGGRRLGPDRHRDRRRPAARARPRARLRPRTLHRASEARQAAAAQGRCARRRRDRLGPGRVARVRRPARRGHPDPADRPGHRARHVLASPPRSARREHRRAFHADAASRGGDGVVRGAQLALVRVRRGRVRVRLLDRGAGGARALGGAVRRFRQRGADHPRPVRGRRALEVERDPPAGPAPAARLRGKRPGALQRPPRALPAVDRGGQHPRHESFHRRAVLPSCSAGRRSTLWRARWW